MAKKLEIITLDGRIELVKDGKLNLSSSLADTRTKVIIHKFDEGLVYVELTPASKNSFALCGKDIKRIIDFLNEG